jgi:hypothetical protein
MFEEHDRLTVCGAGRGSVARLTQVLDRLVAQRAPSRMVSKLLDVLVEAIGVESLDRTDKRCMQPTATVIQQAAVSNLVCQRMLEGVLELRKQPRFV